MSNKKSIKLSELGSSSINVTKIEGFDLELDNGEVVTFPNPVGGKNFDDYNLVIDTVLGLIHGALRYIDFKKIAAEGGNLNLSEIDLNGLVNEIGDLSIARVNAVLNQWAGVEGMAKIKEQGINVEQLFGLLSALIEHFAAAFLSVGETGKDSA